MEKLVEDDDIMIFSALPVPKEKRSKTDNVFFYVFIATLIFWLILGTVGIIIGQPLKINDAEKDIVSPSFSNDILLCLGSMIGMILLATVITIANIYYLRFYAKFMVWASICLSIATIFAIGTFFLIFNFQKYSQDSYLLVHGLFCYVIGIIVAVLLYFFRDRIPLVIELIAEASRTVGDILCTLFFPLIPLLMQCGMVAFAVYSIMCWQSPLVSSSDNTNIWIYLAIGVNIFGMIWSVLFLNAFTNMTLAGTFARWYWTNPKHALIKYPIFHAMKISMCFHLGTVALGSLIMTLIHIIMAILRGICRGAERRNKMLCCCVDYCIPGLTQLLEYFNKNVYIVCSLHGTNFYESAKNTFALLSENITQVYVLKRITLFVMSITQTLIVCITTGIGYGLIQLSNKEDLHAPVTFLYVTCILTLLITSFFTNVFVTAVDTLFICYLEDKKTNDGSPERPYYMSQKLAIIMNKTS